MHDIYKMIAQSAPGEAETSPLAPETLWDPVSIVICTVGLCILVAWMFWFRGFDALQKAPVRRHRWWFVFWPLSILFIWNISFAVILETISSLKGTEIESLPETLVYPIKALLEIGLIITMLIVVRKSFARGLKGFGLKIRTIPKDVAFAIIHLLAVYPLIAMALFTVAAIGQSLNGDFEIQQHQTLKFLSQNSNIAINILMTIIVVGLVPVFEEMLFRGFIQSSLRSVANPWVTIIITSTFFAIIHYPNFTHMPSLFFLSCGLGYAYERSGSLFRPILMHLLFNGTNIALTLFVTS